MCIRDRAWGYSGFQIVNLFSYISPDFKKLKAVNDPIGPLNAWFLRAALENNLDTILMWGNQGNHLGRAQEVIDLLPNAYCFQQNKSGMPQHPLYLPLEQSLQLFNVGLIQC